MPILVTNKINIICLGITGEAGKFPTEQANCSGLNLIPPDVLDDAAKKIVGALEKAA